MVKTKEEKEYRRKADIEARKETVKQYLKGIEEFKKSVGKGIKVGVTADYPQKIKKTKKKDKEVLTKTGKVGKHISSRVRQITKGMLARMKAEAKQQALYRKQVAQQTRLAAQQQTIETSRLAAEQRAYYEQPAEPHYEKPQEQFLENEYDEVEQQRGPGIMKKGLGGFAEAFRKWNYTQRMNRERGMSQRQNMPNLLQPQQSPLVREPRNMLMPVGGQLVREPGNLLNVSGNKINPRLKIW